MGHPTDTQIYKKIEQVEKNVDILDNEITAVKSMLVSQTVMLKEINDRLREWVVNNEQ